MAVVTSVRWGLNCICIHTGYKTIYLLQHNLLEWHSEKKSRWTFPDATEADSWKRNLATERIFSSAAEHPGVNQTLSSLHNWIKGIFYWLKPHTWLAICPVYFSSSTSMITLVCPAEPTAACRPTLSRLLFLELLRVGGSTGTKRFFLPGHQAPAGPDWGLAAVVQAFLNWLLTTRRSPRRSILTLPLFITRLVAMARHSRVGFQTRWITFSGWPAEAPVRNCRLPKIHLQWHFLNISKLKF